VLYGTLPVRAQREWRCPLESEDGDQVAVTLVVQVRRDAQAPRLVPLDGRLVRIPLAEPLDVVGVGPDVRDELPSQLIHAGIPEDLIADDGPVLGLLSHTVPPDLFRQPVEGSGIDLVHQQVPERFGERLRHQGSA